MPFPDVKLANRPLHFLYLCDCSGSMAASGKMQALNQAIRQSLPGMAAVARDNPEARVLVRAVSFADRAAWHIETPTPVDQLEWRDLQAGGITAMGAALQLVAAALQTPPMEVRALPPVLVLISDGQPTDDFAGGLEALRRVPWAQKAVRLAIALGHDADLEVLQRFIGSEPATGAFPPPTAAGGQRHLPGPVHPVGFHGGGGGRLDARQPGERDAPGARGGQHPPAGSAPHRARSHRRRRSRGVVNRWVAPIGASRTGAAHRRAGRPCQDAVLCRELRGLEGQPVMVMAVADGHGGRRYRRSEVGSRLACETALAAVQGALAARPLDTGEEGWRRWLERELPEAIQRDWLEAVAAHWQSDPGEGGFEALLYGSTLGLVVMTPAGGATPAWGTGIWCGWRRTARPGCWRRRTSPPPSGRPPAASASPGPPPCSPAGRGCIRSMAEQASLPWCSAPTASASPVPPMATSSPWRPGWPAATARRTPRRPAPCRRRWTGSAARAAATT